MIILNDTIKLVEVVSDGYGDKSSQTLTDLKCAFLMKSGHSRANHTDIVESDAHAYIDFTNSVVVDKAFRLEGMYVIAPLFGAADSDSWYRIVRVIIAQPKLRSNSIDNVRIFLEKVEAL